jgi:hypothetical protein
LNELFFKFLKISVPSVRTETEPKEPKPNYLGSEISQEPIGSLFCWNRISGGTEESNQTEPKNRTPRASHSLDLGLREGVRPCTSASRDEQPRL